MSLKGFHVLFIVLSIALAVLMSVWAIGMFRSPMGSVGHLATAIASLLVAWALTIYAIRFVRRARRIGLN